MKKIFTSISMALCLAASSFNASAQQATQLSDAQKQEIQQKVLPVVFEQNGLRAASDPYNVQPDSVKLDMTKLGLNPAIAAMLGELTIKFENPQTKTIPMVGILLGKDITIGAPETISVTSSILGNVASIDIALTGEDGALTPFGMDMTISSGIELLPLGNDVPLLSFTMVTNPETNLIEANVDIQQGMRTLWGLLQAVQAVSTPLPDDDYLININMYNILSGNLSLSLYGYPDDDTDESSRVSMGDADIALDIAALLGKTGMPLKYIDITSYESGTANAWSRLQFNMWQAEQDLILQIDNMVYSDADREFFITPQRYTITMSDNTKVTSVQSAANAVVQKVISQLANEGEVAPYEMAITTTIDTNGDGMVNNDDNTLPVMDINVTPTLGDVETKSVAITGATINIVSYSYSETGEATTTTEVDLNVAANEDKIALEIAMDGNVIGSAYFTSNIWDAVTSNEDIQLANVEVTPTKDGIYVSGTTAATYSIVSMSGATVANGTVSGDNAYISTSALAKGIYVIVVTENGESKAVKFAR